MNNEKTPYNPIPGDYDTNKLTDLHSPETDPAHYARNIPNSINISSSKEENIKSENTERIPSLIRFSHINKDNDDFEKKGEI